MSSETRGNGRYFYAARKVRGRVVKQYVGAGAVADIEAALDEHVRGLRHARAEVRRAEHARLAHAGAQMVAFDRATEALARGMLLLAGYRRHARGEWRRKRGR